MLANSSDQVQVLGQITAKQIMHLHLKILETNCIYKKEAQETKYWLRMLAKSDKKIISELRILYVENLEILKIIQSIIIKIENKNV